MNDRYNLQRFVDAQQSVFERACAELRQGRKRTHWMWYVFPQMKGLGTSPLAQKYAISCRDEAEQYLGHPTLGPRLRECARLAIIADKPQIEEIFGYPDDLKFRSSMTLFSNGASDDRVFKDALEKYFHGKPDPLTLGLL